MGIGKCLGFGRLATLFRRQFDGRSTRRARRVPLHQSCNLPVGGASPQIQHCGWEVEGIILRTSTANGTETITDSSSLPFEALPSIESVTVRYNPPG